jgi:Zn-dependent protease with chaperone function
MPNTIKPAGAQSIVKPSAEFQKEVGKVATAIVLFIILYLVLLAIGIAMAFAFGYLGLLIILGIHNLLAIAFGAGLIGIGIMVCYFLVKFVFATKQADGDNAIEINENEYPELFAFIRKISEDVNTTFPKRVLITDDVNASVSYDSNIKALLFPVKKNLTIGLGLVNMINKSEFQAVLAHEFGHFSQGSMRAGSYVYHLNKVIYNLLYENTSYSRTLDRWARIHGAFALCANITIKIVEAIQWILQQAYIVINRSYMSLSRQMEFHADAVAANCAGGNNLISALRRIEFADFAFQKTIDWYNAWFEGKYKGTNLFTQHRITSSSLARINKLPEREGLPIVDKIDEVFVNYRRVNIEDQWSSHPTRAQRETALSLLNAEGKVDETNPWKLFGDKIGDLQVIFTANLYENAKFTDSPKSLDDQMFQKKIEEDLLSENYPDECACFYDRRALSRIDLSELDACEMDDIFEFYNKHGNLFKKIQALREDISLLENVADKKQKIRYFDFDGEKFNAGASQTIQQTLKQQLASLEAELRVNDARVFTHFKFLAGKAGKSQEYKQLIEEMYRIADWTDEINKAVEEVLVQAQRVSNEQHTIESAQLLSTNIGEKVLVARNVLTASIPQMTGTMLLANEEIPEDVSGFLEHSLVFFTADKYNNEALEKNWSSALSVLNWTIDLNFHAQKRLVEYQLGLIKNAEKLSYVIT